MPPEEVWQQFFDPEVILTKLGMRSEFESVVDLGCGYGTFAIPAAARIAGSVYAIDIDAEMIAGTSARARARGLTNLIPMQRDFLAEGTGLAEGCADFVMVFNLLHARESAAILAEASRLLKNRGILAVIHWNFDPATPRGPSMEIRATPESCRYMIQQAGFSPGNCLDLPPYHYGFAAWPL